MRPLFPCRGRQWNSAPSQRVPCHHEWLQLRGHGSWRRPCHLPLLSSPPLCLMGPVLSCLHLRDSLLIHINGDWDGRAFHWWWIWQVVWVPVKLNIEKPLVVLQPGLLLWVFAHWHLSCIILHRFVTNNISVLSSKLVSKAVDFWRLGGQYSRRPSCRLLDKYGALHVWHFVWLHRMMP